MRKILDIVALAALIVLLWITYSALYASEPLPARIPIHFNIFGQPDYWGPATLLIVFPGLALIMYLLITLVSRYSRSFKYPFRVTSKDRPKAEGIALDMLCWLRAEAICLMTWVQFATIGSARNAASGIPPNLPGNLLQISLSVLVATLGWHLIAMRRVSLRSQSE